MGWEHWCSGYGLSVLGTISRLPSSNVREWEDKNKNASLIGILHCSNFSPHGILYVRIFSSALTLF